MTTPVPSIDDVPARPVLPIHRGITLNRSFFRKIDGVPIDISTDVFEGKILSVDGSSTVAVIVVSVVDGPNGKFRMFLDDAATAGLPLGTFPYYVSYTTFGGDTFLLFQGNAVITNLV